MAVYWRPNESEPSRAFVRPTATARLNSAPAVASTPLLLLKPDASTNHTLVPPPRSSLPRIPNRELWMAPVPSRTSEPPLVLAYERYSTFASITP
jgi:hypothetical protein